jgi:hypothetical protein
MTPYISTLERKNYELENEITKLDNIIAQYKGSIEFIFVVYTKGMVFKKLILNLSFVKVPGSLKICELTASPKLKCLHILKTNGEVDEDHLMLDQFKQPDYYVDAVATKFNIKGLPYKLTHHEQ